MLDPQDLRAIQEMIDSSIFGSENRMMTFYENVIQPQLQLLAEGQKTILETLTP